MVRNSRRRFTLNSPVVVVVIDNGMYGSVRAQQERWHPARFSGATLRNPEFVAFETAHGCLGRAECRDGNAANCRARHAVL